MRSLALTLLTGCGQLLGLDSPERMDAGPGDGHLSDGVSTDGKADGGLPATCPASYAIVTGLSNTRYRLVTNNKDWGTAQAVCLADQPTNSSRHTHLAVVTSDLELAALHSAASNQEVWVGLNDSITNTTYLWVTDETTSYPPLTSPPWASGAPGGSAGENCIKIDPNGTLQDTGCGNNRAYMCECDDHANDATHYQ